MTRREFVLGSATFLAAIALGFFSATWVDDHYAAAATAAGTPSQIPSDASACVGGDGSWKNWVWANVPALSPKCE